MKRDSYAILGVSRESSAKEIKSAYRKLCLEYHPDRNKDGEAALRLQEIIRAYEEVSDQKPNRPKSPFRRPDADEFPDIGDSTTSFQKAESVEVTFSEAFTGHKIYTNVDTNAKCNVCGGNGSAPGHQPRVCGRCHGAARHKAGTVTTACSNCDGNGFIIDHPCRNCEGGRIRKQDRAEVLIPAGILNGHNLKVDVPGGVIQVHVTVKPSPVFERKDDLPNDLFIEVPLTYAEAVLGSTVKVPTPTKLLGLRIPAATPSGKTFRVPGQGMPIMGENKRGDLYATTKIDIPENLSTKHSRLINELKTLDDPDIRQALFASVN